MKNRRRKNNERRGNVPAGRKQPSEGWHLFEALTSRSGAAKKKRRRLSGTQLRLLKISAVVVCCIVGLVLARLALQKALYDNPEFTLQVIDFETDGVIGREKIIETAGLEEGMKMMTLDIEDIRNRISAVPEIRSAKIERDLPDRLAIKVEEREPIAWLSCGTANVRARTQSHPKHGIRGLLVDESGVIMECNQLLPRYVQLPVIHVRELGQDRPGEVVEPEQVVTALQLLQLTRKVLFADSLIVKDLKLENEYSIVAEFNSGAVATFGLDDLDAQISRFRRIHEIALQKNERIGTINLLVNRNIPVTSISKKPVADNILVPDPSLNQMDSGRRTIRKRVSRDEIMHSKTAVEIQ